MRIDKEDKIMEDETNREEFNVYLFLERIKALCIADEK